MTAYTVTLRGYSFGQGQSWEWVKYPDGFGPDSYRTSRVSRVGVDGMVPVGGDYVDTQTLVFELQSTVSNIEAEAFELRAAFQPERTGGLVEMTISLWSGATYVVRGRPLAPLFNLNDIQFGRGFARASFEVLDPYWYATATKSAGPVEVGGASGGFVSPFVSPFVSTGSGSSGDGPVQNDGTAPAPWTAYVTATTAMSTPRLILDGQVIEIAGTVPAGSTLTVSSEGWVLLDGAPRPWIAWSSTVWLIPPGASTFSFRAATGTGTALLVWRDTSW